MDTGVVAGTPCGAEGASQTWATATATSIEKPLLLVFKGFSAAFLKQLPYDKLLSLPLTIDIVELDRAKAAMLPEVIGKLTQLPQSQPIWCTLEEYKMVGNDVLSLYFRTVVFENNLYYRTYPCLYRIPKREWLLTKYFSEDGGITPDDDEHRSSDKAHDDYLSIFHNYYGELRRIGGKDYVVYAETEEAIGFFPEEPTTVEKRKLRSDETATLELSEEEEAFLLLTQQLLAEGDGDSSTAHTLIDNTIHHEPPAQSSATSTARLATSQTARPTTWQTTQSRTSQTARLPQDVLISFTGDLDVDPLHYVRRIAIMQTLFPKHRFTLVTKTTEARAIANEPAYRDILQKYWGYDSFRDLRMYKDIHDTARKETVAIPQSHIIDDLVHQAEQAQKGEAYKDIFVTSPTGAGKSVMFQVPAIYLAQTYGLMTIVISPLIGLMTDQVQGLISRNVELSATINSEITPAEKMDIREKIKDGQISILYISPETLLSRSDITMLIGERQIGLFVIDEAHIVTTWGKAFRSDYWYLGNYLQRLRRERQFPIATFTATAIYGGMEDMYAETRDSLNLINPISYFGYVKRDDIEVKIKQNEQQRQYNEYLNDKFKILTYRLEAFVKQGQKTLVYFPTVKLIHTFKSFAEMYGGAQLLEQLTAYFGPQNKEVKNASYLKFKNGEALVMLATKAFGMGIDIPDIVNVYHFAPTGNVCDYVQEIGRAARALPQGYAYFDFLPKDFVHVNRLHGISTIRKHQLIQVMQKVLHIMNRDEKALRHRNLLINAEEFRYIFQQGAALEGSDDVDNKLKTALLIIEKDFKAKLGYSPLIARPRNVFAKEYVMIRRGEEEKILARHGKYFSEKHVFPAGQGVFGNVYSFNMKRLWEANYRHLSYPQFKYKFHQKDEALELDFLEALLPVLQIETTLQTPNIGRFMNELGQYVDKIADLFGSYAKSGKFFRAQDIARGLRRAFGRDKYFCDNLATVLLHSVENYERLRWRNVNFAHKILKYNDQSDSYSLQGSSYGDFLDWLQNDARHLFSAANVTRVNEQVSELYLPKTSRTHIEQRFILLGLLEAMGLLVYRANGGDHPEISLRINSRFQLKRCVDNPEKYSNYILQNVYDRHKLSVAMLTYLFENKVPNEQFWELIEDYFLGKIPAVVEAAVY